MNFAHNNISGMDFKNLKVTVMGLGLNGGGLASAEFFASRGADVTVTDLRSREILMPALNQLKQYNIKYVLGIHRMEDFTGADLVIKNPAVTGDSPYLAGAAAVETDISIFLQLSSCPVIAITGSKGKSTVSSAVYHGIKKKYPQALLGGNITVSPLTFIDRTGPGIPVILELSSWQLGDIRGKGLLKPEISVITNILPDHQNRYSGMEEYAGDKMLIYKDQTKDQHTLCFYDDEWGKKFAADTPGRALFFSSKPLPLPLRGEITDGAWIEESGEGYISFKGKKELIVPQRLLVMGQHNRMNLLIAGTVLYLYGLDSRSIAESAESFSGIAHRMEFAGSFNGISFYNDTTATIPEAVIAAVESFETPVKLISGGTDKNLEFEILYRLKGRTSMIYLLGGSASEKIIPVLQQAGISFKGPYPSLEDAFNKAAAESKTGDNIILSPGCTSFGMFKNEFERGDRFKELVKNLD